MRTYRFLVLLLATLALSACGTFFDKLGETGAHVSLNFMGAELSAGFRGKEIVQAAVAPAIYVLDATGISKQEPPEPAKKPDPTPAAHP